MCVCVCVCVCVRAFVRACMCMSACVCVYVHACVRVRGVFVIYTRHACMNMYLCVSGCRRLVKEKLKTFSFFEVDSIVPPMTTVFSKRRGET